MALIQCHECKNEISTEASACPKCGAKVARPSKWPYVLLSVFVVLGLMIWIGNSPRAREKASARDVIEQCWSQYRSAPVSPGAKGIMAGGCRELERRFQEKYGVAP